MRARRFIERNLIRHFDVRGKFGFDFLLRDRRGEQDATVRGGAGQFRHGNIRRASQCDVWSMLAPRPLASTKDPLPRLRATRSGKASASMPPVESDLSLSSFGVALDTCPSTAAPTAARWRRAAIDHDENCRDARRDRRCLRRDRARSRMAAINAASSPEPTRLESTIMRARRGGRAIARRLLPSLVMRPSSSSASSSRNSSASFSQRRHRRRIEETSATLDHWFPSAPDRAPATIDRADKISGRV